VIRIFDYSFASQDPDEVGCFRQQDLKEAACTSSGGSLGSVSLFIVFLLVFFIGG
jgi:hypothetical protein